MVFEYRKPCTRRGTLRFMVCKHENCGKVFRKWHNFFDHLMIHTNERPYKCPEQHCQMSFTQECNLTKHMEIHFGVKRFKCGLCRREFFTKFNLDSHKKTHLKRKHRHSEELDNQAAEKIERIAFIMDNAKNLRDLSPLKLEEKEDDMEPLTRDTTK